VRQFKLLLCPTISSINYGNGDLQGTNAELAKEILDTSGLAVHSAVQFQEAADKVKEVLS